MTVATMTFDDFVQICCNGKLDDVHAALDDNPAFINHHNPERLNRTALIEMCISGKRDDVIRVLIARGADVNALDDKGQTALHHVMEISSAGTDLVKTLIDAGTDETIVDSNGHDVNRIARILAHPDYKTAYHEAIAARKEIRQQQDATAAAIAQTALDLCVAAVARNHAVIQNRKNHDGARFKL